MGVAFDLNKFPIRFKPESDELLSSWITRLANAHGLNGHTFANLMWEEKRFGDKGRDLDRQFDNELFELLSIKTGINIEQITQASLISYAGYLVEEIPTLGPIPWVMPWNVSTTIKRFGMQFCPECLREDKFPFFRRIWRLSFAVVCVKHKIFLKDRCPNCSEPIIYYWVPTRSLNEKVLPIFVCKNCKFDLRETLPNQEEEKPFLHEISFQHHLEDVLRKGWVNNAMGYNYSHLYFDGIHLLMGSLSGRPGKKLCKALVEYYKLEIKPSFISNENKVIETRSIVERRHLNILTDHLITNWSIDFIKLCQDNKIWVKALLQASAKKENIPFWYWRVIDEHLSRPKYYFSDQEIDSIFNYLNEKNYTLVKSNIRNFLGDPVYRQLIIRGLIGYKSIKDRQCIRCKATEKQRKTSSARTKRPNGNFRYYCGVCKRTYTPQPLISRLFYSQAFRDKAVKLKEKGLSCSKISKMLSVSENSIIKWYQDSKRNSSINLDS